MSFPRCSLLLALVALVLPALLTACTSGPAATATVPPLLSLTPTAPAGSTVTAVPDAESPTAPPATKTPSPGPSPTSEPEGSSEAITFLDADGVTLKSVLPDGSGERDLLVIEKSKGQVVSSLQAAPMGEYLVNGLSDQPYDLSPTYYLASQDAVSKIADLVAPPRFSPDGKWLAGQVPGGESGRGPVFLYELAARSGKEYNANGLPDWFPDRDRLVLALPENVFLYATASDITRQLTNLPNDEQNAWVVQEAHVLPGGSGIIFFGAHYLQDGQPSLGASGNGQQWWWIPLEGGEPQPWTEPEGNGVQAYAPSPAGGRLAYAYTAHSSACVSIQAINVVTAGRTPGVPISPTVPELEPRDDGAAYIRGLSWSLDGARLAFGVQPYTCPDAGSEPLWGEPSIYVWDVGESAPRRLAGGSFPVWVR